MIKLKLGTLFPLSEDFSDFETIELESYTIIQHPTRGLLVQGSRLINIFEEPISIAGIIPLDLEAQKKIKDFPFEYENHHLVYQVSFASNAWYFKDKRTAIAILDIFVQIKEHALHNKYIREKLDDN